MIQERIKTVSIIGNDKGFVVGLSNHVGGNFEKLLSLITLIANKYNKGRELSPLEFQRELLCELQAMQLDSPLAAEVETALKLFDLADYIQSLSQVLDSFRVKAVLKANIEYDFMHLPEVLQPYSVEQAVDYLYNYAIGRTASLVPKTATVDDYV